MLVKRDTVPQERLVTARLVLLIHFLVLKELYLRLHRGDLLVQVEDDILVNDVLLGVCMFA